MDMAAKAKFGRTRDVRPVSFRLTLPQRAALDGAAKRAGVTANEQARVLTVAGLGVKDGVTRPPEAIDSESKGAA